MLKPAIEVVEETKVEEVEMLKELMKRIQIRPGQEAVDKVHKVQLEKSMNTCPSTLKATF
jgi:hypothetical protein